VLGPRLIGKTCLLRPIREDEAELMSRWFEDPAVTRSILRRFAPSLSEERAWLERAATDQNTILWGIEAEGRLVGSSAIHAIDWANQHGQTGTVIGDRAFWGRSLGSGSMWLRTEFAFDQTTLRKLTSSYLEFNLASWRAQAKAGYREVGRRRQHYYRDGRWWDEILTEVMREDWAALRPS
jgi:ribosomal-protein-alanine N-acetyltransferase